MKKADGTGTHLAVSPTRSQLEWDALEGRPLPTAEATGDHLQPGWQAPYGKREKGKLCSGTDREKRKKKKYIPRGTRQILLKKKNLYLRD